MADIPEGYLVHEITIQPYEGQDAYGTDSYGASTVQRAFVQATKQYVRSSDGSEKYVHGVSAIMPPNTAPPVDSQVTFLDNTYEVTSVAHHVDGGLGAWQHDEVLMQ